MDDHVYTPVILKVRLQEAKKELEKLISDGSTQVGYLYLDLLCLSI